MQLSRHTDYSLRVLLFLAVRPHERATLAGIADHFGISHEHLRKVVHELAQAGYINTYQGKGGGLELRRPTDKLKVGEIVQYMEGWRPLIDCDGIACTLSPVCSLKAALAVAQRQFIDTLNRYSIADLAAKRGMARSLLNEEHSINIARQP